MSDQAKIPAVDIKEHGTVTVTKEGVSVMGFHFGLSNSPSSGRQESAESAIDWAIERLEHAKRGEW